MTGLEAGFDHYWRLFDGPPLEAEHRFDAVRRWRFDRAHVAAMVAIELDGGTFSGGRHVRGKGYEGDCEKLNAAAAHGWAVFRLTGGMIDRDPSACLTPIIRAIDARLARRRAPIGAGLQ